MIKTLIGKIAIILGILSILLFGAIFVLLYPIFKVNSTPTIKNSTQLVADCQILIEMKHRGELKLEETDKRIIGMLVKEQWPSSITELKPRRVYVLDDKVYILISTGGIDASYGYLIPYLKRDNYSNIGRKRQIIDEVYVSRTKFKDIYYWSGIE